MKKFINIYRILDTWKNCLRTLSFFNIGLRLRRTYNTFFRGDAFPPGLSKSLGRAPEKMYKQVKKQITVILQLK